MSGPQPWNAHLYAIREPILALLQSYGQDLPEPEILHRIQTHLAKNSIQTMDTLIFGSSATNSEAMLRQNLLQSMILLPHHHPDREPVSPALELTARALADLYENPTIDIFVIVAGSPEIIPLLRLIKRKNKLSYLISPQTGPATISHQYADIHQYLEDLLQLPPPNPSTHRQDALETLLAVDTDTISQLDLRRATEAARYFHRSHIHHRAASTGNPVPLQSYLTIAAQATARHPSEVLSTLRLAHHLKYLTIYEDPQWGLCIKEGENITNCEV